MYCPNCGADLHEGSIYCSRCGAEIEVAPPPEQRAPVKAKPRLRWLAVIAGLVISAAILIPLGLLVIPGNPITYTGVIIVALLGIVFGYLAGGATAGLIAKANEVEHGMLVGLVIIISYTIYLISTGHIGGYEGYSIWHAILGIPFITIIGMGLGALGGALGGWIRRR